MAYHVIEQAERVLKGIEIGYFNTGGHYEFRDEYYKYFSDPDPQARRHALAVFTRMLKDWDSESCFVFMPVKVWRDRGEEPYYQFEDYLAAFLKHHKKIEQEFPVMHEYIIKFLIQIEKRKGHSYEGWFPEVDPKIFEELRKEILITKSYLKDRSTSMKYFLREVGIAPFFKADSIKKE